MTVEVVDRKAHRADLFKKLTEAAERAEAPTRIEGPGLFEAFGAVVKGIFKLEKISESDNATCNFPPKFKR